MIARHATKRYYEAPSEYIAAEWGKEGIPSFKPEQFTEQDGLLNRDTKTNGWWTVREPLRPNFFVLTGSFLCNVCSFREILRGGSHRASSPRDVHVLSMLASPATTG